MKSIHVLGAIYGFLIAGMLVIYIHVQWNDADGNVSEVLFSIIALVVVGAIGFAIRIPLDKWWQNLQIHMKKRTQGREITNLHSFIYLGNKLNERPPNLFPNI